MGATADPAGKGDGEEVDVVAAVAAARRMTRRRWTCQVRMVDDDLVLLGISLAATPTGRALTIGWVVGYLRVTVDRRPITPAGELVDEVEAFLADQAAG